MNIQLTSRRAALTLVAAAALIPSAAHADKALLVGVNQYPGLKNANLEGCVGDAQSMAQLLTAQGFQTTVLRDQQATKQGIMNALATMRAQCKPNERFVFFFAGHGTDGTEGDTAALLPNDAKHDSTGNDLKRMELYRALQNVPARSRTALLDSCYSGGMLEGTKSFGRVRRTRYYARDIGGGAKSFQQGKVVPVNDDDPNSNIAGGPSVCYYTAARDNEQAAEDTFNNTRRGVFTYYLARALAEKARAPKRPLWGEVHTGVTGEVSSYLKDIQHPTLSPHYAEVPIFEARGEGKPPAPAPKESTVWDELNSETVDPSKLQLMLKPNRTTLNLGDRMRFEVKVNAPGYLLLLEKGTSGKLAILHPYNDKGPIDVQQAAVQAGTIVSIPGPNEEYQAGDPTTGEGVGTEFLKAILFPTREAAQEFLSKFPQAGAKREILKRDLQRIKIPQLRKITSDITFQVLGPNQTGAGK